jgi:hypothetical protein
VLFDQIENQLVSDDAHRAVPHFPQHAVHSPHHSGETGEQGLTEASPTGRRSTCATPRSIRLPCLVGRVEPFAFCGIMRPERGGASFRRTLGISIPPLCASSRGSPSFPKAKRHPEAALLVPAKRLEGLTAPSTCWPPRCHRAFLSDQLLQLDPPSIPRPDLAELSRLR